MIRRLHRHRADRPANCHTVVALLQAYLDGEIDQPHARRIADHLEDCRRCGLEAATYQQIKRSLARRTAVPVEAVERLRAFGEQLCRGDNPDPPHVLHGQR